VTSAQWLQKLRVDVKTVHGWEKGRHWPSIGVEKQLVEFLGYDPFIGIRA